MPISQDLVLPRGENLLEKLKSYSYSIVLRAYNFDLDSKFGEPDKLTAADLEKKTFVVAATGGTAQWSNRLGSPDLTGDVFIKSLTMTSANGMAGAQGRVSPVTELKLNVVETGGAEFLSSLMAGTAIVNQRDSSKPREVVLNQEAPFLLTISFHAESATDDALKTELAKLTKHIKVRITKCQFNIKSDGIYYEVMCTPYAHMAMTDIMQSSNTNQSFTVTGAKISEFVDDLKKQINDYEKKLNTDDKNNVRPVYEYDIRWQGAKSELFKNAFLNAVNSENSDTNLESLPISDANDYIKDPDQQDSSSPTAQTQAAAKGQGGTVQVEAPAAGSKRVVNVPQGTPVQSVIEKLCLNSTVLAEALKDKKNPPPFVPFVRVIPIIETKKESQPGTGRLLKTVIYNIVGIEIPVAKSINNRNPDSAKIVMDRVKNQTFRSYRYLFTGGNQSILNFDVRYDNLFTQAYTAFSKHGKEINQALNRTSVSPETAGSAATREKDKAGDNKSAPGGQESTERQNNTSTPVAQTGQNVMQAGQPKDYQNLAQEFRTLLPEIFNDQVEKSMYRINLEIVGDPEFISEVDIFKTQEQLEAAVKKYEANPSAKPDEKTKATPEFNNFDQYYIQINLGNKDSKRKDMSSIPFGGYYMPIRFTHNFTESGKYTTTIDAVKIQGLDLKVVSAAANPGAASVGEDPAKGSAVAPSTPSGGATAPAGGGLNSTLADVKAVKAATAEGLKTAADIGAAAAQNVTTQVKLPGAPGSSPPQQIVAAVGKLDIPVPLPSTTAGPASKEAALASAEKNLGGSLDANPGSDADKPAPNKLIAAISDTNKQSEEAQKLSATAGAAVDALSGEVNNMMSGAKDKATSLMKGAMAPGGALDKAKDAIGGLKDKLASKLTPPSVSAIAKGDTNVVEQAASGAVGAAKTATEVLATKIPSFQIPGMPQMNVPSKEDLTKAIQSAGTVATQAIDTATGQLQKPEVQAAVADVAGKAKGIAGDLTAKAKDIGGNLAAQAKDVGGKLSAEAGKIGEEIKKEVGNLPSPFSPDQIKDNAKKYVTALSDKLKSVTGAAGATSPQDIFKKISGGVSGAGMSDAIPSAEAALTKGLGAATTALSSATAAMSKGLGGTSLGNIAASGAAANPLSGLKNQLGAAAGKVTSAAKTASAELSKGDVSAAVKASADKAIGELAKISLPTINSTPGLSALSEEDKVSMANKLSVGSLAKSNGFQNVIPGSVKPVGLNDVAPAMVLDSKTGEWAKAPTAAVESALAAGTDNINNALASAKNLAPTLQASASKLTSNSAVAKLVG